MAHSDPYSNDTRPAIVLFSRHFPPHVSGGARRPYYLVKALRALGCRVFVVAPALPEDVEGVAVPHVQPDPVTSAPVRPGARDMLRDWLFWPDPDIRWTKRAVKTALAALPFKPDWVMTTSPPESVHYAGRYFKKHLGCLWYADMRDHWLVRPFRKQRESLFRNFIEQKIATGMLQQADMVSAVNAPIAAEMRGYAGEKSKVFILPHFSILEDTLGAELPGEKLNLVYTGSFSLSDPACKIADTLLVFENACAQNPALHLHIAGRLSEEEMKRIEASPCTRKITLHGVVSLQQSHALQRAAQALVLSGSCHAVTPPGKAAEYASRGKPVIAITRAPWAALYNGEKTAVERLVALREDTPATRTETPATQRDAAEKVLDTMAMVHARGLK